MAMELSKICGTCGKGFDTRSKEPNNRCRTNCTSLARILVIERSGRREPQDILTSILKNPGLFFKELFLYLRAARTRSHRSDFHACSESQRPRYLRADFPD